MISTTLHIPGTSVPLTCILKMIYFVNGPFKVLIDYIKYLNVTQDNTSNQSNVSFLGGQLSNQAVRHQS